ncbi:MAG: outer membrane lipoprotein-sorting protein [Treponema sp.]|nr:outer membrane lipoprotein-sorting protein [Treponema sp.]
MKVTRIVLGTVLLFAGSLAFAQTAQEIAKKVHDLPDGKTNSSEATMTLIDKNGKTRIREVASYTMHEGTTKKSVMVFRTPKDVAGVSYLSFEYPDNPDGSVKDSDSWLYLPAMKKVRRVSGSNKDDDFQGTDFTYDDIGDRSMGKDTFAILGEEEVKGVPCWKLEYTAKDKNAKISRRILWIGKENYVVHQGEYYDKAGKLKKTLDCEGITQINGYWTIQKMTMTNVQSKHSTVYQVKDQQFDIAIDAAYFTVSALERELLK